MQPMIDLGTFQRHPLQITKHWTVDDVLRRVYQRAMEVSLPLGGGGAKTDLSDRGPTATGEMTPTCSASANGQDVIRDDETHKHP